MKVFVALSLSLCVLNFSAGEFRTAGRSFRTEIASRATLPISSICNDSTKVMKYYCDGDPICDAKSVVNCVSSNAGYKIPCPQEKPYCVVPSAGKATCSSTPSEECAPALPPFQCTSIGIFPDPTNCEIYYNCYEENPRVIRAEPLYCPPGYLFNPDSTSKQYCLLASTPSDCVTVTGCEGATTSKIVPINFTNSTLFVALCIPGSQPWIFQCKSDFGRYSCFMQFSL